MKKRGWAKKLIKKFYLLAQIKNIINIFVILPV